MYKTSSGNYGLYVCAGNVMVEHIPTERTCPLGSTEGYFWDEKLQQPIPEDSGEWEDNLRVEALNSEDETFHLACFATK